MQEVDEVGNVHDRIVQMVDYFCKGNKAAFGRATNIQSGVLAGLIGGRKNKPSFEVLQKILTGYPSVNPTWLLFGRGPMLYTDEASSGKTVDPFSGSGALIRAAHSKPGAGIEKWQDMADQLNEVTKRLNAIDKEAAELAVTRDAEAVVYMIAGPPHQKLPYNGLLTERLNISEEQARELIEKQLLEAWHVGEPGLLINWRTSEAKVRDFLKHTPSEQRLAAQSRSKQQKK